MIGFKNRESRKKKKTEKSSGGDYVTRQILK